MAQFSVNANRFDPYKNFKFRVKWDGRYVAGVSKVGALKRSTSPVEHREDARGICRIELSRRGRRGQRYMEQFENARLRRIRRRPLAQADGRTELRGTRMYHFPVRQDNDPRRETLLREAQAEFGADASRLARRDSDHRCHAQRSSSRKST